MIVGGGDNQLMSEINVTPFVDVMLVLLIIFMVAAPMMTQGVDVALPEVKAESLPQDDEVPFVVSVDKAGKVFINEFEVEPDRLNAKLLAIFKQKPTEKVFLRADKRVPYGTVMDVMAQIRGAGIEKLGMITEPASEKKI
ncbi:MAG: protein TolR [Desulfobacteraceae bacterium]|jgi:biopolymer transport protein TolR